MRRCSDYFHNRRANVGEVLSYRDILKDRFDKAEGQVLKDRPPEIKRKWFKTRYPECGESIRYAPKENWNVQLKCGSYQHEFRLALLSHFSIEYRD